MNTAQDTAQESFQADLHQYRGPVDLLLYLVRRNELLVGELSLETLILQYLEFIESLDRIDIDGAGEFLEVASLLIESKMRSILPSTDDDADADSSDPREDLVHRLLLYKDFKDVSILLEEQSRSWQNRFPRLASDLPQREINLFDQPIEEVELWDLVSSFGRVLRNNAPRAPASIVLDDTPIHVYMRRIRERLGETGHLKFIDLFEPGMHKSVIVGMFLAVLELVRHHQVRAEQVGDYGEIRLLPGQNADPPVTIDEIEGQERAMFTKRL